MAIYKRVIIYCVFCVVTFSTFFSLFFYFHWWEKMTQGTLQWDQVYSISYYTWGYEDVRRWSLLADELTISRIISFFRKFFTSYLRSVIQRPFFYVLQFFGSVFHTDPFLFLWIFLSVPAILLFLVPPLLIFRFIRKKNKRNIEHRQFWMLLVIWTGMISNMTLTFLYDPATLERWVSITPFLSLTLGYSLKLIKQLPFNLRSLPSQALLRRVQQLSYRRTLVTILLVALSLQIITFAPFYPFIMKMGRSLPY